MRKDNYLMKRVRWVCIAVCILGVLIGFAFYVGSSKKEPKILLSEECKDLEIKIANMIAEDIRDVILTSQAEIYKIDNFTFLFSSKEEKNKDISFCIAVTADWTMIRKPIDNPIIIGMYKAYNEFDNEKEKEIAHEIINGFLAEMKPDYMQSEIVTYEVVAMFDETDSMHYELYYPIVNGEEENLIPLKEYFIVEDRSEKIELGKNTILEMVELELK